MLTAKQARRLTDINMMVNGDEFIKGVVALILKHIENVARTQSTYKTEFDLKIANNGINDPDSIDFLVEIALEKLGYTTYYNREKRIIVIGWYDKHQVLN